MFPFLFRTAMQCNSEWPNNYLILSCAVCGCISMEKLKINYTHPCFSNFVLFCCFVLLGLGVGFFVGLSFGILFLE